MSVEMKDSGIDWIGEIPKHWNMLMLKNAVSIKRGGSPRPIEEYISDIGYNWIKIGDTTKGSKYISSCQVKIKESGLSKTRKVQVNDLILTNSMSFGEPYILKIDGCIHDGWVVFSDYKNIDKEFLYYFLLSPFCKQQFDLQVAGGVVQNLNIDKIGTTLLLLPPKEEQFRIANFLDKKCAEIDELIALQEQMIAQLNTYKQAVITETVTKGLNPNVKMKDSGVEWIGEIPEHWDKDKIIRMFKTIGSGTTPKSTEDSNFQGTINWLQSGDINGNIITESKHKISLETLKEYSVLKIYKAPFIVVAMYGASVGNISISDIDACVNQACCVMSNSKHDFRFLFYTIKSAKNYLIYRAVGGGQPNISQDTLKNLWLPNPPLSEQQSIAQYLDQKCKEIDELISIKKEKIEHLKAYKKSVIYEYVTGKKQVFDN